MYIVLRIEVSIKQNIFSDSYKKECILLVGLYLAISAVITQRSQCVFFLVSFSVLRCRSRLGLDLRCIVWWRGLRGYFWLLHRFLFRILGTLCYLHKYYEAKKAMESKKSHTYSVTGMYMKTATASMNDCYTRYLPPTANSRCSKLTTKIRFFFWQLGSRYLSRLLSPTVKKLRKGKNRKTLQVYTFSRRQSSF